MKEEQYKILPNGHEVTCAVIIIGDDEQILGCHSTGKSFTLGSYDLPKGHSDEGEDDLDAAVREVKEETGWDISSFRDRIVDLGIVQYVSKKDLHGFLLQLSNEELKDIDRLKCKSFFDRNGVKLPEVNGFRYISKSERNLFFQSIQNALVRLGVSDE